MTKLIVACLAFAATFLTLPAHAHVKVGTYAGVLASGEACSFEVKSVVFEGGLRHPLAERVTIVYQGTQWILSHPAVVDTATGNVGFEHGVLRDVHPVAGGAQAAVLAMVESEGRDGPGKLTLMSHDYASNARSQSSCDQLSFVGVSRAPAVLGSYDLLDL